MTVRNLATGRSYDLDKVAKALRGKNLETSSEYEREKESLIDMTMSCDVEEAVAFLVGLARTTVELSPGSMDVSKRVEFLACYDLATSINKRAFA